jgi:beta-1,2-mannobiose phosphorylase / 1,2-beta-oligomannan phosphorylase
MNRRRFLSLALTPPMMRWSDSSRLGRPFAKDPCVIRFGGQYWLYYSLPPFTDDRKKSGWGIGVATSRNLVEWTKRGEIAPRADYESAGFCAPGLVVIGKTVHMFYQTYGGGRNDAICHATSTDGLEFRRNPANPVLRAKGNWNCGRAIDAEPCLAGNRLFLFAATRDPDYKRQMIFGAAADVRSGFRPDDFQQLADRPLLAPELDWERNCIEAPSTLRRNYRFTMFYAGGYNNEPQQIGCASSVDGVQWRRLSDRPFLANGAEGEWNASESGHPGVFQDRGGKTYLFFQGNPDKGRTWELGCVPLGWKGDAPVVL